MRDIKFKVWDKLNKKTSEIVLSSEFCIYREYTGLKDMDGVEIYEGDICSYAYMCISEEGEGRYHYDGVIAVVFPDFLFKFRDYYNKDFKIIGNIYENPEIRYWNH